MAPSYDGLFRIAVSKTLKSDPYTPASFGTSIATALEGKVRLGVNPPVLPTKLVEGSGKSFNTIWPNDFSFFEIVNETGADGAGHLF